MKQPTTNQSAERKSGWNKSVKYFGIIECGICGLDLNVTTPASITNDAGVVSQHPLGFSEDHIIPQSLGGANDPDNLRPVHIFCNEARGNRDVTVEMRSRLIKFIEEFLENPIVEIVTSNTVSCQECKKEFYAQNARILKYGKRYCSNECRVESLKTSITLNCEHCKNDFLITPSRIQSGRGKYCSKECYAESSGGIKRKCTVCKNAYFIASSNTRKAVLEFCSTCRKLPKNLKTH